MGRIIAGTLASRKFATPKTANTRPTTDRVRESVFAWLASALDRGGQSGENHLVGLTFLDLYAGSGAVGLEAASRGAEVTWVEKDRPTARLIESNARTLGIKGSVVAGDVSTFLASNPRPYSIIWMDPPYEISTEDVNTALRLITTQEWLAEDGIILVERSIRSPQVEFPENFLNNSSRRYGDTVVYIGMEG